MLYIMKKLLAICLMICLSSLAKADDFCKGWSFWSDRNPSKVMVSLPHDAMQTEQRSDTVVDGRHNGFFPGGVYHYEKTINVPAEWLNKHVTLHFEGVYQKSTVSINGKKAEGAVYGYTPFTICADGLLHEGDNKILVDVDNSKTPNSRWYSGAGIYRPVQLIVQDSVHINNVRISTRSMQPAVINVDTRSNGGMARTTIYWKGEKVATGLGSNVCINIPDAKLWSADEPNLYQVVTELLEGSKVVDKVTKDFGIRQITWSPLGLFVNGKKILLKGGCIHHDNGILGACEYDDAAYRKIAIMKQYGYNAIRSAHNPCSEALLRACDKLGMYIMDELWDMWYVRKTQYDYSQYWEANHDVDMKAMVDKDYNHPSVLLYSIGNEIMEPADDKGIKLEQQLIDRLHKLDPSRPVTAGMNLTIMYMRKNGGNFEQLLNAKKEEKVKQAFVSSEQYNNMVAKVGEGMLQHVKLPEVDTVATPALDMLDISGYNYASTRYEEDGKLHPNRIIVGSETFPYKISENWEMVNRLPYLVGDFMWTAWDYIGETSVGCWYNTDDEPTKVSQKYPCLLNGGGAIDLIGNPTGEALLAKAIWLKDNKPYIGVQPITGKGLIKAPWRGTNAIPSWSWKGMNGEKGVVEVFTSAPIVRLYLNNLLIGEKKVDKNVASFDVAYEPGVLKAVTVDDNGKEQEAELVSAKGKIHILATTERDDYKAGDLIFLDIDLADADGTVESNVDTQLSVNVKGGTLLGFGSANPRTTERFQTGKYTTFYGRSQAIIRADNPGKVIVSVSGKGLHSIKKEIIIK